MCMSEVKKDYRNVKERNFGIGYKNVTDEGDGKYSTYKTDLRMKKWYKANTNCKIKASDKTLYRSGFHIFLNKEDAQKYCSYNVVVRVRYRGVSSFGTNKAGYDDIGDCVIADEMFLDEVVK